MAFMIVGVARVSAGWASPGRSSRMWPQPQPRPAKLNLRQTFTRFPRHQEKACFAGRLFHVGKHPVVLGVTYAVKLHRSDHWSHSLSWGQGSGDTRHAQPFTPGFLALGTGTGVSLSPFQCILLSQKRSFMLMCLLS